MSKSELTSLAEIIPEPTMVRLFIIGETNHASSVQHQTEANALPELAQMGFNTLALEGISPQASNETIREERSRVMSDNLKSLLKNPDSKVVALMGASHLTWQPQPNTSFVGADYKVATVELK